MAEEMMGKKSQEFKRKAPHCLATKNIVPKQRFLHVITDTINWFIVPNYLRL